MCNLYLIWCNQRFWKSTISCWKFSRKSLKHSSPATPLVAGIQCFRHADFIGASGIGLRVVPVHLQSYVATNPTTLYRTIYAHDFVVFCFGPVKLLWFVSLCELFSLNPGNMMASSNGNIFRVTGPLCGEFPAPRPVTWSLDFSLSLEFSLICAWINGWVNNPVAGDITSTMM